MKKILLVCDDFSEMSYIEVAMKKMGFDVVSIGNEILIPFQILRFNPDVVVAFGNSKRVSTTNVGRKMKEGYRYVGKSVLVFHADHPPRPADLKDMKMDAVLSSPLTVQKLLQSMGKIFGLNADAMIEKYHKYEISGELPPRNIKVSKLRGQRDEPAPSSEPEDRYKKLTQSVHIDTKRTSFVKKEVKMHQEDLKKDWSMESISELDGLKRQFVDALFRKK